MIDSVLGVDHVGVGVRAMAAMRAFYEGVFGFQLLGQMPEEDHPALHGLLRTDRAVHSSTLLANPAGGLRVALFHATYPAPRATRAHPRYGDVCVAKLTFAVVDLDSFRRESAASLDFICPPKSVTPRNGRSYRFVYARDPECNLLELVSGGLWEARSNPVLVCVGIAVTDLDRSLAFYRDVLGFDRLVFAPHEDFSGLLVLLPLQTVDDPARPVGFMYLRDPDGIPVEMLAVD